jgi:hypothetical protein
MQTVRRGLLLRAFHSISSEKSGAEVQTIGGLKDIQAVSIATVSAVSQLSRNADSEAVSHVAPGSELRPRSITLG